MENIYKLCQQDCENAVILGNAMNLRKYFQLSPEDLGDMRGESETDLSEEEYIRNEIGSHLHRI